MRIVKLPRWGFKKYTQFNIRELRDETLWHIGPYGFMYYDNGKVNLEKNSWQEGNCPTHLLCTKRVTHTQYPKINV